MEARDFRDYQASCAVCGRPADGECVSGCETDRLNLAIEQAETQWLNKWREQTREWVAHNAVKYVTQSFAAMKEARLATFAADLKTIPYYHIFEQYRGRPPLHPHYTAAIQRAIQQAEFDLRRNIDSDWRSCVLRYPEVLNHYFSLINVNLPKEADPPSAIIPTVPAFPPPQQALPAKPARSTTGSTATASQRKARRVSLSMGTKGKDKDDQSLETIAKLLQSQNIGNFGGGMRPPAGAKAGRGSPVYDTASKAGGKKRLTQEFLALSGKGSALPRAPTAPPSSHGPWKLPGAF